MKSNTPHIQKYYPSHLRIVLKNYALVISKVHALTGLNVTFAVRVTEEKPATHTRVHSR